MADSTTTNYAFVKPEVGASSDTWGTKLNSDLDAVDALLGGTGAQKAKPNLEGGAWKVDGTAVTSSAAELNILDGVTATTAQLNGVSPTLSGTITIAGGTQNWTVTASGANLTFAYNGTNKMRLDSSGNITVTGNVTAYGTL